MKKVLLISTLFFAAAFAATANNTFSLLEIRHVANMPIVVEIDGIETGHADFVHRIYPIAPGRKNLRIFRLVQRPHQPQPRKELIYRHHIDIPPGTELRVELTPAGFIRVIEAFAIQPPPPVYYEPAPVFYPMDPAAFNQLKGLIANAWFDSSKIAIASQAMRHNYFTTSQVRELMGLYSFESSRLEIARMAYSRTLDQANYFFIFDQFWFSSSIDEMVAFLNRQ